MVQEEELMNPTGSGNGSQYTVHKFVTHEPQDDGTTLYLIKWYVFGEEKDTLEPLKKLPRTKVVQYEKSKRLKHPQ